MTGFWSPLFAAVGLFFQAWGEALLASMPPWLRKHFATAQNPQRVELNSLANLAGQTGLSGRDLDLVIKDQLVIIHHVTLPKAAASEIPKVVKLEADRVMPVRTEELYVAHDIIGKNADGSLNLIMVAARRIALDQVLREAYKLGLVVRSLVVQAGDVEVPLRTSEIRSLKSKRITMLALAVGMAFLLAIKIPGFYLAHLEEGILQTEEAIRVARQNTVKIAGLQDQVDALQDLSNAVTAVKTEGQVLELLSVLTSLSPDTVKVDELRLVGRRLFLRGRAVAPEDWVIQIQKNAAFKDVRLTAVLGQTQAPFRQFDVHMTVLWPEERTVQ